MDIPAYLKLFKMNADHFTRLLLIVVILFVNTIYASRAYSERYVKVATIGNTPPVLKSENKQEIVNHVINFWNEELKQVLHDSPDLIVLPELCDLSMDGKDYLKVRKNQVLDFFATVAKSNHCYIAFGMQREDTNGYWYNSCVVIGRNGEITGIYDKNYPTIGEMELGIKASNEAPVIQFDFGRAAIVICFDLNFEELRLKYQKEKPDLIIFSSMFHGGIAQNLWAYSCESYLISAVYRNYPSEIRNPIGNVIATTTHNEDYAVAKINLDFTMVHIAYNQFHLMGLKEKYGKTVKISDPGEYASVIVTSENERVSVIQMLKEFEIEDFNEYLDHVREFRLEDGNLK